VLFALFGFTGVCGRKSTRRAPHIAVRRAPLVRRPASAHLPQRDTPREPGPPRAVDEYDARQPGHRHADDAGLASERARGLHRAHAAPGLCRFFGHHTARLSGRKAAYQVAVRTPGSPLVLTQQAAKCAPVAVTTH
jgi:hypothetical protein